LARPRGQIADLGTRAQECMECVRVVGSKCVVGCVQENVRRLAFREPARDLGGPGLRDRMALREVFVWDASHERVRCGRPHDHRQVRLARAGLGVDEALAGVDPACVEDHSGMGRDEPSFRRWATPQCTRNGPRIDHGATEHTEVRGKDRGRRSDSVPLVRTRARPRTPHLSDLCVSVSPWSKIPWPAR